jgi:hypothetical protein
MEHFSPGLLGSGARSLWHSVTGPGGLRWVSA